ncbi:hypothetical protein DL93DRAFT_1907420 [Clavulina sp. PMI_390]|nr:hypothetical protein DL93DRAFT_1907420 [Clavulina sp. PMI_390]
MAEKSSENSTAPLNRAVTYHFSNRSLRNTVITTPDSQTSYIIETPIGWRTHPTTVSKRAPVKPETVPVTRRVATVEWRCWGGDLLTLAGKEPIRIDNYFPKKWYNW